MCAVWKVDTLRVSTELMFHYDDVIMGGWRLKSPASPLVTTTTNRLFRRRFKENIKAPRRWPLCEEFTGDRWIPRTNGQ